MTTREIALIVAVECAHHLQDIAPEFRQDPLFMRWVCLKAPGAVYYALGESKTSADVGLAALRSWLAKDNQKLGPNQIQVFEQVQWFGPHEVPFWDSSWQGISPGQAAFLLARALPKGFSFLPLRFKEKPTIALVAVHCWPGNMSLLPSSVSAIPWFWFRLYHGGNVKQAHLPSEKRWDPDMWSDIIVHGCGAAQQGLVEMLDNHNADFMESLLHHCFDCDRNPRDIASWDLWFSKKRDFSFYVLMTRMIGSMQDAIDAWSFIPKHYQDDLKATGGSCPCQLRPRWVAPNVSLSQHVFRLSN